MIKLFQQVWAWLRRILTWKQKPQPAQSPGPATVGPAACVAPSPTVNPVPQPPPPLPVTPPQSRSKATGSVIPTRVSAAMQKPDITPCHDRDLNRMIVEFSRDGAIYRIPACLAERYEVTGVLSVGGFGVIYVGRDQRLFGKKVLIKANRYSRRSLKIPNNRAVLKEIEDQRGRMVHERKMLLNGYRRGIGGIPILLDEVYDLGLDLYGPHDDGQGGTHYYTLDDQWRNEPYLILSFVDGIPLSKVLDQQNFTNNLLGNAKQIILQVGRMLAAFHKEQMREGKRFSFIYQDLKPDNIIFTREKQPILIDFGGFAVRKDGQTVAKFARTGTPGYQPPEFLDGTPVDRLDFRVDVFTLGMTIYHVLGGVAPKADAQGNAIKDPGVMQKFDPPWREWIERATRPDREQRFANIQQAIQAAHTLPLKISA